MPKNSVDPDMISNITEYGIISVYTVCHSLRKHAYSNILKILPPKTESF